MLRSNRTGESALPHFPGKLSRLFLWTAHWQSGFHDTVGECNAIINRCFGECDLTCQHFPPVWGLFMDRCQRKGRAGFQYAATPSMRIPKTSDQPAIVPHRRISYAQMRCGRDCWRRIGRGPPIWYKELKTQVSARTEVVVQPCSRCRTGATHLVRVGPARADFSSVTIGQLNSANFQKGASFCQSFVCFA